MFSSLNPPIKTASPKRWKHKSMIVLQCCFSSIHNICKSHCDTALTDAFCSLCFLPKILSSFSTNEAWKTSSCLVYQRFSIEAPNYHKKKKRKKNKNIFSLSLSESLSTNWARVHLRRIWDRSALHGFHTLTQAWGHSAAWGEHFHYSLILTLCFWWIQTCPLINKVLNLHAFMLERNVTSSITNDF